MRAVQYDEFGGRPEVREAADPLPDRAGAVIRVAATGLCRSDWHGWMGHDPDIRDFPHVPGHELAGVVEAVGGEVRGWRPGDRVTTPFVCACGSCPSCAAGDQQVCERQTQPGFTHWGSFAEYVAVGNADVNLVRLPDAMTFPTAASLGCRFATAFRAVVAQGRVAAGEWVAVYGCGGVGLSAVMIAAACGARVIAVDVSAAARQLATGLGATHAVPAEDAPAVVREITGGGAHLTVDALGSPATCGAAIESLRRRGRHVQVGLLPAAAGHPAVPMDRVIGLELTILGSHGMAAHAYPPMLGMIADGRLRPDVLITRTIGLDEAPEALTTMASAGVPGVTVIVPTPR
ncbi:alcohol dehydrogenase [Sphaerisporangium melleum]|uniref:Alcohol dehydrogenase n=1 Tax=Sphaerisporangium melleum TaxID=321316 RepID=A0A917QPK4_9ACTN|nr:zinc-dependent alcohol dehydrogenase family protein [Sphaerisporangium melleum]GGK62473.1 alcohol dehydrogenase [Sphaerisporangium melleum]GII67970.1 alcohol dehydrogenase [Sphaerisporangium melleum]